MPNSYHISIIISNENALSIGTFRYFINASSDQNDEKLNTKAVKVNPQMNNNQEQFHYKAYFKQHDSSCHE